MGLEIFTPKRFPRNLDNRSASVAFETDKSLTIPAPVLDELNSYDFYQAPVNPRIDFLINYYFENAIVTYMFPMFTQMVSRFKGRILLRAFGLTAETETYFDFANLVAGPFFERLWMKASDRFWFAAGYPSLVGIEPNFIQERSVLLPVGLPERILSKQDTWRGGDKRIMFVCPDIETYREAKEVYSEFKQVFGDLPHVICGNQTVPVAYDDNVVGRLSSEEYERLFQEAEVMFYHSKLPRHLHYHPVEAAAYGMPVVFMNQGMLGSLGGDYQAGGCSTLAEARRKVENLLTASDPLLKTKITSDQKKIVQYFNVSYVRTAWETNFLNSVLQTPLPAFTKLRIGILTLDVGSLSALIAIDIANALKSLKQSELSVTLGIDSVQRRYVRDGILSNVSVRDIQWIHANIDNLLIAEKLSGFNIQMYNGHYHLPEDNMGYFMDADVWVVVGNPSSVAVTPLRPTIQVPILPSTKIGGRKLSPSQGAEFNIAANMYHVRAIADLANVGDFLRSEYAVHKDKFLKLEHSDFDNSVNRSIAHEIYRTAGAIA
ncbi:WbcT protein [Brucella sp. NF 2653]|nr:WbcT protein [Brucella sp. NF 2653]